MPLFFVFFVPTKTWRGVQFLVLNLRRDLRRKQLTSSHSHKRNQKCSASQWWSNCHGKLPKSCRGTVPQHIWPWSWSSCTWSSMALDGGVQKITMCHYMTAPYKTSLLMIKQIPGWLDRKLTIPFKVVHNKKPDSNTWFKIFSVGYFDHITKLLKRDQRHKTKG